MITRLFLFVISLLALARPAWSLPYAGHWRLEADGIGIFQFDVAQRNGMISVRWNKPTYYETDGDHFNEVTGPAQVIRSSRATVRGNYLIAKFGKRGTGDTLDIEYVNSNQLSLRFDSVKDIRLVLIRSSHNSTIGPWSKAATYSVSHFYTTNAEMTALAAADQRDRAVGNINWSVVGPADQRRRQRAMALLNAGLLQSGTDCSNAALVMHHGNTPQDYLLAHLLAIAALSRGRPDAAWLAAASMDRYLQSIGKAQVLGTQFTGESSTSLIPPSDSTRVPESLRTLLHLPRLKK